MDAVLLSDWLHTPWTGTFDVVFGTNLPASAVPWLASRPAGYNTTFAGIRASFYNLGNTDPRVVAHDENTRDTGTLAEAATIPLVTFNPAITQGITAPVLLAVGQYDSIFCGPLWPCDSRADRRGPGAPQLHRHARPNRLRPAQRRTQHQPAPQLAGVVRGGDAVGRRPAQVTGARRCGLADPDAGTGQRLTARAAQ